MKKICILLIHGSGTDHQKKLEKYQDKLLKILEKKGMSSEMFEFELVNWHPAIQVNQEDLWSNYITKKVKLKWKFLRKFVLFNMADNFVYSGLSDNKNEAYHKIHNEIHKSILHLKNKAGEKSPLIIICSSMGTTIASNYIWDRQKLVENDPLGNSSFERLETLTGLFMFGCTIPMYAGAYYANDYKCINFPDKNIADHLKSLAEWHVYYDAQDVLGYPLKAINKDYNQRIKHEEKVNIGGLLTFWNTASHIKYWKSRKLKKKVANYINNIVDQIN